ncbi:NADPH-dependent F420 reductase [Candidatus Bathyarchaeota archaeon]|nr:NADPH-dependent F420 reductase [Candidatus Bathyarchaeota archaeon]MBL7080072.1 NADPH-dependent F420 reductase [Candidatus Bathyarchaeota archaeon]
MKVGIIGGTGNMGRGLTIRLALRHDILVGSRSLVKAGTIAKNLKNVARGFYLSDLEGSIAGVLNADAIEGSEVVIVCLPAKYSLLTLEGLKEYLTPEKVVVSTVVPMTRKEKLFYWTPLEEGEDPGFGERSASESIQEIVAPSPVVTAFQTVPAAYLNNIDAVLNVDVLIAGDDDLALAKVSKLVRDIPNLRPLRVGPLVNSKWVESITPLLLNAAVLNGLHDPTIRVIPWMPSEE